MAITKTERQIKFATANTKSISAGGNDTSDAITGVADEILITQTIKADNAGTPASGDTVDVYVMKTAGDPDADPDSADEYPDVNHLDHLCTLDTNATDPAITTKQFSVAGCTAWKLYFESNAATNSITVSSSGHGLDLE